MEVFVNKIVCLAVALAVAPVIIGAQEAQSATQGSAAVENSTPVVTVQPTQNASGAAGETVGDFSFKAGIISDYSGSGGDASIPDTVNGAAVTAIGGGTFMGKSLSSVTIPDGVKVIGWAAFQGCGLESVTIPATVKSIVWSAFRGNPLKSITIGSGVVLGNYLTFDNDFDAFYRFNNLRAGTYTWDGKQWGYKPADDATTTAAPAASESAAIAPSTGTASSGVAQ
jgi:hypothetical protein